LIAEGRRVVVIADEPRDTARDRIPLLTECALQDSCAHALVRADFRGAAGLRVVAPGRADDLQQLQLHVPLRSFT
jgi:hypothetical protein